MENCIKSSGKRGSQSKLPSSLWLSANVVIFVWCSCQFKKKMALNLTILEQHDIRINNGDRKRGIKLLLAFSLNVCWMESCGWNLSRMWKWWTHVLGVLEVTQTWGQPRASRLLISSSKSTSTFLWWILSDWHFKTALWIFWNFKLRYVFQWCLQLLQETMSNEVQSFY